MACVGVRRTEVKALGGEGATRGIDLGPTTIGNSAWTGARALHMHQRLLSPPHGKRDGKGMLGACCNWLAAAPLLANGA